MSKIPLKTGTCTPDPGSYRGRPLGRILRKIGKFTREQVFEALIIQAEAKARRKECLLGQILIEKGLCTAADIELALQLQCGAIDHPPPSIL